MQASVFGRTLAFNLQPELRLARRQAYESRDQGRYAQTHSGHIIAAVEEPAADGSIVIAHRGNRVGRYRSDAKMINESVPPMSAPVDRKRLWPWNLINRPLSTRSAHTTRLQSARPCSGIFPRSQSPPFREGHECKHRPTAAASE